MVCRLVSGFVDKVLNNFYRNYKNMFKGSLTKFVEYLLTRARK